MHVFCEYYMYYYHSTCIKSYRVRLCSGERSSMGKQRRLGAAKPSMSDVRNHSHRTTPAPVTEKVCAEVA